MIVSINLSVVTRERQKREPTLVDKVSDLAEMNEVAKLTP